MKTVSKSVGVALLIVTMACNAFADGPIYSAPVEFAPVPAPPLVNAWYFCRSVGQYYPYTQYCPEGWQLVAPTRP